MKTIKTDQLSAHIFAFTINLQLPDGLKTMLMNDTIEYFYCAQIHPTTQLWQSGFAGDQGRYNGGARQAGVTAGTASQ